MMVLVLLKRSEVMMVLLLLKRSEVMMVLVLLKRTTTTSQRTVTTVLNQLFDIRCPVNCEVRKLHEG